MAARLPGRSITADSGFELMDRRIDPDLRFNSRAAKPQLASNAAEDRRISGISAANRGCNSRLQIAAAHHGCQWRPQIELELPVDRVPGL
jgi:hypothetical protein